MQSTFQGLKRSLLHSLLTAFLTTIVSSVMATAYMATLPTAESTASDETKESYAEWKKSLYGPVAIVALVVAPMVAGVARFTSLYPPCPIKFSWAFTILALVAVIAHWTTSPLKGPPKTGVVLLSVLFFALVILGYGFCRAHSATRDSEQTT